MPSPSGDIEPQSQWRSMTLFRDGGTAGIELPHGRRIAQGELGKLGVAADLLENLPGSCAFRALVAPGGPHVGEPTQMHGALIVGEAIEPRLLHGESEHRGKPGSEAQEDLIQHSQRRTASEAVVRVAIERVLANIEIEGGEIVDA